MLKIVRSDASLVIGKLFSLVQTDVDRAVARAHHQTSDRRAQVHADVQYCPLIELIEIRRRLSRGTELGVRPKRKHFA